MRVQAQHGRSMEDEARDILHAALSTESICGQHDLAEWIRNRIEPFCGIDLELPSREAIRGRVDLGA
ncbi:FitA-like ribbon-helix-helix domain-containing protein [Paraburkholderia sp. Cpub6]|uniref:FitA-like ribbon-helix-helix domain-containing protein n=1 Tax=Paraburkholderia sp. Cpub6 TaxID=2723094 RepID=UPI00161853BA